MVTFEHLVKQADESTDDKCRNGLRVLEHPKKYFGKLNRNKASVGNQIDVLGKQTDRMYDELSESAVHAVNYLKAAQCMRLKQRKK